MHVVGAYKQESIAVILSGGTRTISVPRSFLSEWEMGLDVYFPFFCLRAISLAANILRRTKEEAVGLPGSCKN